MGPECRRCLLNEDVPGVRLHEDGECSVCKGHDAAWGDWGSRKGERLATLEAIFETAKKKHRTYDALVPLSGGKDSTYVLYLCRKRFGLRCLAVSWDSGFMSDHARANIKRAVDILGVDHMWYSINWPLLKRLYRAFFLQTGLFCPVCMRGISLAISAAARAFDVPVVVGGTSLRTEEHVAPEFFVDGQVDFFASVLDSLEDRALAEEARFMCDRGEVERRLAYVLATRAGVEATPLDTSINLADYIDWNYDEVFHTITTELGWTAHRPDAEHADCRVETAVQAIRHKKYPALEPELLRYSKLASIGALTKEQARRKVEEVGASFDEDGSVDELLRSLDIPREQFDEVLRDPTRHMKYLAPRGTLRPLVRSVVSRIMPPHR